MVRRATVAHSGPDFPIKKVVSLSLAALERSTGGDPNLARNRSKLSVRTWMLNGRTLRRNIERLEGAGALPHQPDYQRKISPDRRQQSELPEMDTSWYGQQSTDNRFHPISQTKSQGSSKHGWVRGLDRGRRTIGASAIVNQSPVTI